MKSVVNKRAYKANGIDTKNTTATSSKKQVKDTNAPIQEEGLTVIEDSTYAIQPKLWVNPLNDPYEKEADAMAEQVGRSFHAWSLGDNTQGILATKEEADTLSINSLKSYNGNGWGINSAVEVDLEGTKGNGTTLPFSTRKFMENAFSADFSSVNIHNNKNANLLNRQLGAKAFTHGNDIYFDSGQYNPNSLEGNKLLAHELTHVVQQQGSNHSAIQRRSNSQSSNPSLVNALGRTQELIDRMNLLSPSLQYRIEGRGLLYEIIDETTLSNFDWLMLGLIDTNGLTLFKLIERFGLLTQGLGLGLNEGSIRANETIDDLLVAEDEGLKTVLLIAFNNSNEQAIDRPVDDSAVALVELAQGQRAESSPSDSESFANGDTTISAPSSNEEVEEGAITDAASASVSDSASAAGAAIARLTDEPLMPPPPTELGAAATGRLGQAQSGARRTARSSSNLPTDQEITEEARRGVTEPDEEARANASAELTNQLKERPQPSPEIEELCENIRAVIKAKRPPDEDALLEADPEEAANEAGNQLNQSISSDVERVDGEYQDLESTPAGTPQQIGETPELPPTEFPTQEINAEGAAPDPIPTEEVSLDADVERTQAAMEEAGMNTEVAGVIEDSSNPVVAARDAHGELSQTAAESPEQVLAKQDESIASAQTKMQDLQLQALQALQESRSSTVSGTGSQQTALVGTEEQKRAEIGRRAEAKFTSAQTSVNDLLRPLTATAMGMWTTGKDRIATEFRQHLDEVQSWVDERHSGVGGFFVGIGDYFTGLPSWVTREYDSAEFNFSESICDKIKEISTYVNGIVGTCEEIIDTADKDIKKIFEDARGELGDWVDQEQGRFATRLEGLKDNVHETRDNFNRDLANQAAQAVQEVREEVHALREAAKGLLGRIADAFNEFLEDPLRFIINGLLSLVGIAPASFWALINKIEQAISDIANDPWGFADNLLAAVGKGFEQFFDNFGTHLLGGFLEWIFSGLGAIGVQIPPDFSLSSVITFFLQIMGITWERIKGLLAKHIGEENVELIEQAFEIVSDLIAMGPTGIYEMIKEQLDPQRLMDMVMQAAIDYMVQAIMERVAVRLLLLFNPVGAIVQAVEAIYRVLKWIFENAARIFSLIETIVNGIADIIAGNISGMASAVEIALTKLLVPVIDFVAGYLGLGDLPEKVAEIVGGMQEWVEGVMDRAITWVANQAKALMERLGFGGEEEEAEEGGNELEDSEVGKSIPFSADGERHRLWIADRGNLTVMVASETMELEDRLSGWVNIVDTVPEENQNEAKGLLSSTSSQLNITLTEAQQAKLAIEEAEANLTEANVAKAEEEDNEVESAEQQLVTKLTRLFEIFGEESILVKYKSEIEEIDDKALDKITTELQNNESKYQEKGSWEDVKGEMIGDNNLVNPLHNKPLGTASDNHEFGRFNFKEQFVPGLGDAMTNLGKTDEDLKGKTREEYAKNRKGVIHGGTPPEGEQETLNERQSALKALQDQMFNQSDRSVSKVKIINYFEKSLQGSTTHTEYKPQNIQSRIENGMFILTYDYGEDAEQKGGKRDFIVRIKLLDIKGGISIQTVKGDNLALKVPGTRGYTASSGSYGSTVNTNGVNIHSAHLIADQFLGSGYKDALNLILTSGKFNTETMGDAEKSIVNRIKDVQRANPEKLVTFSLLVGAKWKALSDDPVLSVLEKVLSSKDKKINSEDLDLLAEETRKNLTSKQDPKQVLEVSYKALIYADGQALVKAKAKTAHEDKWLKKVFT